MRRVFVTGAAGFIGSHLTDRLLAEGKAVVACDNLSSGRLENLSRHIGNPRFSFQQLDLRSPADVVEAMAGCSVVFHIAAHADVRAGAANTHIDLHNGTVATHNVLEAMRLNGVAEIVFASSASVYGETPPVPMTEDYGPAHPISLYGAAKVAAEALVSAYCHTFNMRGWIFRFANIIGARRRQGVVYDFVNRLKEDPSRLEVLGDGSQSKPYLHVSECVDGMLFGYAHAAGRVNLFNLGVETATDVRSVAAIVLREMGLNETRVEYGSADRGWPGDAPQLRFDMRRMNELGWSARLTSDEAVALAAKEHHQEVNTCRP
jgi:UDP-glucose 4-epimerase